MSDESREKFRAKYRAAISPYYSGWIHMITLCVTAGCLMWWALAQLNGFVWTDLWIVPAAFLASNIGEYAGHRWFGHQKTKLMKLFYQRHTGDHHTFFEEHAMAFQMVLDWRVVIFPIYLIVLFTVLVAIPGGLILTWLFNVNVGLLFGTVTISQYFLYELLHFSYHVPRGTRTERVFLAIPGWKYLRLFHTVHHNRDLMHDANFNVTFPITDWLVGTLKFSSGDERAPDQGWVKPATLAE
ncbi:sterol desaturase family protein [Roseovarius sp. CAU 1744]|uniref:sterol desaturase family protein n=1 Tax=Roseovarius sp. CAU 1744 TaxID=3140368 RepID=UPI00325C205C